MFKNYDLKHSFEISKFNIKNFFYTLPLHFLLFTLDLNFAPVVKWI